MLLTDSKRLRTATSRKTNEVRKTYNLIISRKFLLHSCKTCNCIVPLTTESRKVKFLFILECCSNDQI